MQIWLVLGIVFVTACMVRYAECHIGRRRGEAESSEIEEERLPVRRTRSNLPVLRIRLARTERDFDDLGVGLSYNCALKRYIIYLIKDEFNFALRRVHLFSRSELEQFQPCS